jgi:hypothetical protein
MGGCGLDSSGSRQGDVAGPFEHGHETVGSIKCGQISYRSNDILALEEGVCSL